MWEEGLATKVLGLGNKIDFHSRRPWRDFATKRGCMWEERLAVKSVFMKEYRV